MTWLNINANISNRDAIPANDTLTSLPKQFCWEHDSTQKFKEALRSPSTQTLIREFLNDNESIANVNISLQKVENIFIATAKRCLKIKTIKKHKRAQLSSNKKWFDKECRLKRHELRKLANQKHRDPLNVILREEYHTVLKQYKNLLNNKRNEYYNNKISELEETALDSDKKHFWNCLKSIDDSVKLKHTPLISEENWMKHFQSLHSNDPLNSDQQNLIYELRKQEDNKMQSHPLDFFITEAEIRPAVKKLKNNKSPYSDKIRNEMIKTSLNEMILVYQKLFNNILDLGSMPQMWCGGLITPIFKSGGRNDPSNYRGICVSSCLGKLFCSILNQRLLEHVNSLNILHKSQIGFLPNNRTADHVLTLRTLIDKYVNCHHEKVYACFVDFRKAFDSVWHDGLLYKLLQNNVGGNFYNLIKSLYYNSTGSIRIGNNQTRPFQYARGVRQGCILSPLLFNLYINDLPFSFDNILSDPFVLPNGTKLNSLLYADDLIILSRSKTGLQNCLNALAQYCTSWMLQINPKKTKIMVFQKRAKKYECNFYIDKEKIDTVQNYTYLGTRISSSENFTLSLDHLREKALHALFALRRHVDLSRLKPSLACKIFDTMISPILTYNSEAWGVFAKSDFKSWDTSPIEKSHLQFCKRYLQVNNKASNIACRAEMGRFPLTFDINKRILKYISYLQNKDQNSFVVQSLIMSIDLHCNGKNSFYSSVINMLNYYDIPFNFNHDTLDDTKITYPVDQMKKKYIAYWKHSLCNSQKLEFYNTIKDSYTPSPYLHLTRKNPNRKTLVKLRISNHKLLIETGRYNNVPRSDRLCTICGHNVEDETHFLFHCPRYSSLRDNFFSKIDHVISNPKQLSISTLIVQLMNSTDYYINMQLVQFISFCFEMRDKLLSNS